MVLKPGTGSFGTVCRCQVLLEKWNLHLHKVGQQQEAWSALKLPGIRLCWPWTSENTVDQHQQITWHPKTITECGNFTLDLKQRGFCASPFFLQTLGPWFPKEMQNLLSSENITLDHSAAVQSRRFWCCQLFTEWLDTRNATAETHVLHTSVRSGSWSTDSSCSPLFVNLPHIFEWVLFHNPLQGCGYPYCLYTFFYHIFSFPSPLY